ncbi:NAD-dependent epimerase/dehydratase family protein [Frigidibacter sp. MR17.24]|uniref:NAD-dependent epimerase/dehydratase family protein n=1 Tax=Frigidibacter sp. MR17.24 TaxID=3127345 RepID=UPI003012DA58
MEVLVTGGAGFIGSHLCERLVAEGHAVTAVDDLSTGSRDNLAAIDGHPRFRLVEGSVLDAPLVTRLAAGAGMIVHLAAAVGVGLIMREPARSILTNVAGTETVLRAAIPNRVRTFIASSSEVYGKATKFPFHEDDDLTIGPTRNLRWSYACAKALDEFLALGHARDAGLPVTVLRFFNTTGPRQSGRYGMVLPSFVAAALAGRPLQVHGSGAQTRCFAHVSDVVEAVWRLMAAPGTAGEVFNIGTDAEISIRALAEAVIAATGSASTIETLPYGDVHPAGFEDMDRRLPDLAKLQAATGFRPCRPLAEIIADTVAQMR